jgi:hypothetical protein
MRIVDVDSNGYRKLKEKLTGGRKLEIDKNQHQKGDRSREQIL